MTKYSSFKQQQLITESWRTFMVEQQPQTQQQKVQLDFRNPANIKRFILAPIGDVGSPGPDAVTKQNFQKNPNILVAATKVTQPIQAAQSVEQILNALSPQDVEEVRKAAQVILSASNNKPAQKESLIKENLTLSAIEALGGGSFDKGIQRIGAGAFITGVAIALAQLCQGDLNGASAVGIKTIVNGIQKLYTSNNVSDLDKILNSITDAVGTAANVGKRDDSIYEGAHLDDGTLVCEACLQELLESQRTIIQEAKYQGRTVTLNKPMKGDVKKSKVYVKDPSTGNVKKVNFGDPNMTIKKNIPARRKSFRARHNCDNPGPKTKAKYWSCRAW
jgi:hypothetical protein